jgi:hypothetical protein
VVGCNSLLFYAGFGVHSDPIGGDFGGRRMLLCDGSRLRSCCGRAVVGSAHALKSVYYLDGK